MVEVDLHAELFKRMGIPRDQRAVIVLEGRNTRLIQCAAQAVRGFVNDRLVATDGKHTGRFAPGDAAADNDDLFLPENGVIGKGTLAGALRVDSTVDH